MKQTSVQPSYRSSRVRRWVAYLWREAIRESWRPVAPAFAKPNPAEWDDARVTGAWLGHATVLINFFGIKILTDPVLFPRIGIRLPGFTIGPKRLTASALEFDELPKIDVILLSHAHFDHLDLRTLRCFDENTSVISARATSDLLRRTRFRGVTELDWGEGKTFKTAAGEIDLAIMSIGAYNPWIRSHCTPEQAVEIANAAGARFIMPVHHQTFRLSFEPLREPIERFQAALRDQPERIALREIGETFVLP